MSDSNDLQTALDAAAQNVGSATIIDFTNAIRSAGVGGNFGVRTIANFDENGNVYVADVNNGAAMGWGLTTNVRAGDLSVTAADMDALSVFDALST